MNDIALVFVQAILIMITLFSDWFMFCEILVQRPIGRKTFHLPSRMSRLDIQYMKKMAARRFDQIMAVLREMPRPMLLMIR